MAHSEFASFVDGLVAQYDARVLTFHALRLLSSEAHCAALDRSVAPTHSQKRALASAQAWGFGR